MNFIELFAELAGLTTFIFAGVAQLKSFGVAGAWLTRSAYLLGLLVGGSYRYFVHPPALAVDWFWLVMFGMAGGFLATGAYKGLESASGKGRIIEGELVQITGSDSGTIRVNPGEVG